MSLLFYDSFDGADPDPGKWTTVADWALTTGQFRHGTRSLAATGNGSAGWRKQVASGDEDDVFIVGFGYRWNGGARDGSANNGIVRLAGDNGATDHITLTVLSTGALRVRRGAGNGTTLGTTAAGVVVAASWVHVALKITLHDSTGTVDVEVNGINALTLTSQDTKNGGTNTTFSTVKILEAEGWLDDFYLCNGIASGITGAPNDNFLGDVKVTYRGADTDATVEWTPSTGTDHANLVDEIPPNTSDYNASAVDGDFDMFNMENLVDTGVTVYGVLISSYAAKDDAGAREYRHRVDSDSTIATGPDKAPSVTPSYLTFWDIFQADPDTGVAWTAAGVNAATFGVEARDV